MIKIHHPSNKFERLVNAEKKARRKARATRASYAGVDTGKASSSEIRRRKQELKEQETAYELKTETQVS